MSVNPNDRPDDIKRDPLLERAYAAGAADGPPAALDAAILAAARREVGARPRGSGGMPAVARPSAVRKWYVPMSIAAVLVLSVSVVTMMRDQQGDELYQPPAAQAPSPAATPPPDAAKQAAPAAPMAERAEPAKTEARSDPPPQRAVESEAKQALPKPSPDAAPAGSPRAQATTAPSGTGAPNAPAVATISPGGPASPEAVGNAAPAPAAPPVAARAPMVQAPAAAPVQPSPPIPPAAVLPPRAAAPTARPEPFPGVAQREAPSAAMRDAAPLAKALPPTREDADRSAAAEATAPPAAPAAPAKPAESGSSRARQSSGAVPAEEARAPALALKRAAPMAATRPAWLIELENQPPEKWLERLAELKREGRTIDVDTLLAEFRKRFPDHPGSR